MCNVPSFVLCAKKNSIQHPTLDWVQIRDVGTFGKWHKSVNGGELMGYVPTLYLFIWQPQKVQARIKGSDKDCSDKD